jgi:hypothetical protein
MDAIGAFRDGHIEAIIDQDASGAGTFCGRRRCNAQRLLSKRREFARCQIFLANLHPVHAGGGDLCDLLG